MQTVSSTNELQAVLEKTKSKKVGFVPTMGALHNGHLSLVRAAKQKSDFVVVSIFVNPLQFNNKQDLEKYPRNIEKDIQLLINEGCDLVFAPNYENVYPDGLPKVNLDISSIDTKLEGAHRPGHFDGVIQVLHRLFDLVKPDEVFFGLKDFQQCLVVKKLIDTYFPEIKLNLEPIVREDSGLAMSSRNTRLSTDGKKLSTNISKVLFESKELFGSKTPKEIIEIGIDKLKNAGIETEYLSVADADSFDFADIWERGKKYIILAAVYVEGVRLIDNIFLN